MAIPRLVVLGLGAIAVVAALLIATLLVVYRPSIEYAYVDIIDLRRDGGSGWWAVAAVVAGVVALSVAVLIRRRRRAGRSGAA